MAASNAAHSCDKKSAEIKEKPGRFKRDGFYKTSLTEILAVHGFNVSESYWKFDDVNGAMIYPREIFPPRWIEIQLPVRLLT